MTDPRQDEFDAFRAEAKNMGMPVDIQPEEVGAKLPSAQEMLRRAKAAEAESNGKGAGRKHRGLRPRVLLAVAATAAVVLGVYVLDLNGNAPAVADTPPVLDFEFAKARDIAWAPGRDARSELIRLADVAAAQESTNPPDTIQYVATESWFIEITAGQGASKAELTPGRRESWLHPDGSFTARESSGAPLRPDGRHDLKQPPRRLPSSSVHSYPAGSLNARAAIRLGNDPSHVRTLVLRDTECRSESPSPTRASCIVGMVTSLADNHVIPPGTLAAFWRILADEPSVRSLGVVRDREGRPGVGISLIEPDTKQFRQILIISPRTGQLLGTETILIRSDKSVDLHPPAIYQFSAILASRLTSDPGPTAPNKP